ncbi:hypothetical protein RRG08_049277 [Elysia crispata]|uniref:Uncharacterized protein n=1 Tax=Elysia crispata TaxID=231223 RepID=A0AAE1DJH9_9GAST|nr:hypothetical protein RRG08_049277 [Elysia crispata]
MCLSLHALGVVDIGVDIRNVTERCRHKKCDLPLECDWLYWTHRSATVKYLVSPAQSPVCPGARWRMVVVCPQDQTLQNAVCTETSISCAHPVSCEFLIEIITVYSTLFASLFDISETRAAQEGVMRVVPASTLDPVFVSPALPQLVYNLQQVEDLRLFLYRLPLVDHRELQQTQTLEHWKMLVVSDALPTASRARHGSSHLSVEPRLSSRSHRASRASTICTA